jgi:predicted DsbA family dithiol-disulfide isomerase
MQIEVYADVVCPWCYIGERRLEKALEQRPEVQIERVWRPYQLRPDMPRSGRPWAEFVRTKFGGEARAKAAFAQVTAVGASEGLEFNFDKIASSANTVDAHRLILLGREHGREWEVAKALFAAYFSQGHNLNDLEDLVKTATEAGLEEEAVRDYLASDANTEEVNASQETAMELGIQGVPFYVIDGRYGISGAQPTEVFLKAIDMVQAEYEAVK